MVVNQRNPYMFGLHLLSSTGDLDHDPIDLGDETLDAAIARLEAKLATAPDGETHFALAEILFRNAFAALDAIQHYEAAVRLAPEAHRFGETLGARAIYLGFYEYAIPFLEALDPLPFESLGAANLSAGRYEQAERWYELALAQDWSSKSVRRGLREANRRLGR
jgi:tetratricopeptide (TPR) repeat protein